MPVLVPLEYTGPPAETQTAQVPVIQQLTADVGAEPLFEGDDTKPVRASWVDDMFDDEDNDGDGSS